MGMSESENRRPENQMFKIKKKSKKTNNDLQNTTQKPKDWAAQTKQNKNTWGEFICSGRVNSSCSTSGPTHSVNTKSEI